MADEDTLSLRFHGAAGTVTGSCMEFQLGGRHLLVDCGMFQGSRSLEALNHGSFDFDIDKIDAVVLTHAHIDHCGLLPKLVAQGWKGKIWCTQATSDLLEYMLGDAGRIQESEAERHNRRRDRAGEERFVPIYTAEDALKAWRMSEPVEREEWFEPVPGFRARLWNAGHILGSASVELMVGGVHILCSGDLGPEHKAFHPDPEAPAQLDYVICESTYGDRARQKLTMAQRRSQLEREIKDAIARGGNLVIPTFALERTQELLLDIARLADANRIPNVPVFVDSPLASRATKVFAAHADELEDICGDDIFHHPAIHYVEDVKESMRINTLSGAIIMAASGMCEAGRIRHHLKHNLHRRESTVLFVGFQAQGTLGRVILEGAKRVRISGEDINVRAQIRRIDSYSAHADRDELLAWIAARRPIAGSLFLSHGESEAIASLKAQVEKDDPKLRVIKPQIGEVYALGAGEPARRTQTGRLDLEQMAGTDWQNEYADFVSNLKAHLGKIRDEKARKQALGDMRRVLDSYNEARERQKRRHAPGDNDQV
ncbi:MBL fold metallo-hydrolase [Novosphingobium pentaromativorans]|uniref:Beta-lactamase-like protein n=1 Tax=Novosphingobium pentaromativorans US6-1 TaxID=1088721 RepID=G6EHG2_9SPHN|nr:MBL fold metallo-hydrolase [Novosphingobium pentaromativorans]AIT81883.1 beta-lactamase [Novosphingobium pentaromativorans US6-1]EHJ59451.1 beta-lactamase-like protein [Novosphingobium pentaromativorans US6-1]